MINRRPSLLSVLSSSTLQSNVILPSITEYYDYLCKVIIIGPSGSGKTCLLKRFLNLEIKDSRPTIGVEFHSKTIELQKNLHLKLQLWDTAGQERYKSITTNYYRGSSGVILCFDLTNDNSLIILESDIKDLVNLTNTLIISCLVVGNKCDLVNEIKISQQELTEFMESMKSKYNLDISSIYNCSAVSGFNVYDVFETIGSMIMSKVDQGIIDLRDINCGVQLGNKQITHSESNMNLLLLANKVDGNKKRNCCF